MSDSSFVLGFTREELRDLENDLPQIQRSLHAVLDAPFERVTGAHWPLAPAQGEDLVTYRHSLEWLAGLSAARKRRLQIGYFTRQPGFLVDLARYQLQQKRQARAAS